MCVYVCICVYMYIHTHTHTAHLDIIELPQPSMLRRRSLCDTIERERENKERRS
jgi:hypothetical protein